MIAGFEIKKGWHVNIDAAYIHYDPALYKDPEQFNPSRFEVSGFIFFILFFLIFEVSNSYRSIWRKS